MLDGLFAYLLIGVDGVHVLVLFLYMFVSSYGSRELGHGSDNTLWESSEEGHETVKMEY